MDQFRIAPEHQTRKVSQVLKTQVTKSLSISCLYTLPIFKFFDDPERIKATVSS